MLNQWVEFNLKLTKKTLEQIEMKSSMSFISSKITFRATFILYVHLIFCTRICLMYDHFFFLNNIILMSISLNLSTLCTDLVFLLIFCAFLLQLLTKWKMWGKYVFPGMFPFLRFLIPAKPWSLKEAIFLDNLVSHNTHMPWIAIYWNHFVFPMVVKQ